MSIIHAGEIDIAYKETGPVNGTAIILVRGQGTQLVHWPEEFYDPFAAAGFRTIRFDNRDTGLSTKFDRIGGKELRSAVNDHRRQRIPPALHIGGHGAGCHRIAGWS